MLIPLTPSFCNRETLCELYAQAIELHQQGIHLVSTDEKTGIQALERLTPTLSMQPTVVSDLNLSTSVMELKFANLEVAGQ